MQFYSSSRWPRAALASLIILDICLSDCQSISSDMVGRTLLKLGGWMYLCPRKIEFVFVTSYVVRGQGQKSGQIFNFVRFQRLRCQIVSLEPEIKNVQVNFLSNLFWRGQRSMKGQISNVRFEKLRCQTVSLEPEIKSVSCWSLCQTFPSGVKGQGKVKLSTLSDF